MSTKMKHGIRQRHKGGGWQYVVELPPDKTGKRRQKTKSGFATRKEAEAARRKGLDRLNAGGDPYPEHLTARDYIERWIEHQASQVRPRTLERYRQLLDAHVLPVVGDVQLDRVRPAHVRDVLNAMTDKGRAPRTIIQARAVLGVAMRQAVADGLIVSNPVVAIKPPKPERPKLAVPSAEQLAVFIEASKHDPVWEIPMLLAATTGARRSEVLGVAWSALDLDAGKLRIVQTAQKGPHGKGVVFAEPKTDRSRRELVLLPVVVERLRRYRKEQAERRIALGPEWNDNDLVCEGGTGEPLTPDAMSDAFKRIAARAGLDARSRLHDLRHGVGTAMLEKGVHPAIASAVLGHSSPAFTMSVYQHVTDGMTEQAAAALSRALEGRST